MSKRTQRGSGFAAPLLTEKDESGVPTDGSYITIYKLCTSPLYPNFRVRPSVLKDMRFETYSGVLKLYNKYSSRDYDKFYNIHAKEILQLGLNKFTLHSRLAPIADLIECFQTIEQRPRWKTKRRCISFGIRTSVLLDYAANLAKSRDTGEPLVLPTLPSPLKNNMRKDLIVFGEREIKVGASESQKLRVEKGALYNQFVEWCRLQGVEQRDGALMAIETLMRDYPVDGLEPVGEYKVLTEFDKAAIARPKERSDRQRTIVVKAGICSKAERIIWHYNNDPANSTRPKLTFSSYCNNALLHLNAKMPLKYSDPQAYAELQKQKQDAEYNERLMKNGGV